MVCFLKKLNLVFLFFFCRILKSTHMHARSALSEVLLYPAVISLTAQWQHALALCPAAHQVFCLLPQPPLSSLPSHLLVLDSVGPCGGAPHPAITWYRVNWVTLITSRPRISRRPAAVVERKVWPSLITAAPAYLHNLQPCCSAPIGVCDSEVRGRHAGLQQGEGERPLMWERGCV